MLDMKTIQKIPLQQIDLSDDTFSVNYLPDLQSLRSSIEADRINSARAFEEEVGMDTRLSVDSEEFLC